MYNISLFDENITIFNRKESDFTMAPYLKKMDRSSVVQHVIDCLTQAMLDGELKPGDRIPTEIELTEQLGVARNSVREAIKILVYIGVLEIRRAEGTYVCDGFSDSLIDPMIYGIILNQQNTQNLNELRALMETGILRLAVQKCTDEEIHGLEERLLDLKKVIFEDNADPAKVFEYDNAFHDAITAMSDNEMVSKLNSMVLLLTNSTRFNSVKKMITTGRNEELYLAHKRVYEMVSTRQERELYSSIRGTYFVDEDDVVAES